MIGKPSFITCLDGKSKGNIVLRVILNTMTMKNASTSLHNVLKTNESRRTDRLTKCR